MSDNQKNNLPKDKEILAQNIAFFRKKMNLSQVELGKKVDSSNKNISKWEKGETTPDVFTLKKLASIFNIPTDALLNPITEENKHAIKTQTTVPFKWKLYMLLLINSILILFTCITFYIFQSIGFSAFPLGYLFIYILPAIDLSVFIFMCCVKKKVEIISLSALGWLLAICIHITFANFPKIGYIYVIAGGYQLLIFFLAALINSGKIIKLNKIILQKFRNKG